MQRPTPDLCFRCECSASQGAPSRDVNSIVYYRIEEVVIRSHNSIDAFFQTQVPKTAGIRLGFDSKSLVPRRLLAASRERLGRFRPLTHQNSIKPVRTDISAMISRVARSCRQCKLWVEKCFRAGTRPQHVSRSLVPS
jgi:hypothetical protein